MRMGAIQPSSGKAALQWQASRVDVAESAATTHRVNLRPFSPYSVTYPIRLGQKGRELARKIDGERLSGFLDGDQRGQLKRTEAADQALGALLATRGDMPPYCTKSQNATSSG